VRRQGRDAGCVRSPVVLHPRRAGRAAGTTDELVDLARCHAEVLRGPCRFLATAAHMYVETELPSRVADEAAQPPQLNTQLSRVTRRFADQARPVSAPLDLCTRAEAGAMPPRASFTLHVRSLDSQIAAAVAARFRRSPPRTGSRSPESVERWLREGGCQLFPHSELSVLAGSMRRAFCAGR
jgi:hypothetical protein